MYKQKSWNVENMHMGVIKAFIVVSMLFVCMFSMKISARAEELNEYYFKTYGLNENTSAYTYHTNECKFSTDINLCFVFAGNYEEVDLNGNVFNASKYYPCMSYKDGVHMFYYSYTKTRLNEKYEVIKTIPSSSSLNFYNLDYIKNGGYVDFVTSVWKPLETNIPIFESIEDAQYYFETGEIKKDIEPTFTDEDIYDPQYSFIGLDCGQLYGATWDGVTEPFIDTTLENIEEKVQVRVAYYDFDTKELNHFTLSLVDTSVGKWAELRESVHERVHGELSYLEFTPYYINNGQIYYGQSIQYNIRDKQTSGTGHNHIADDDSYYVSSVIKGSHENTLGYLQGVSMKRGNDSTGSKMLYVSWDTSNEELADCRIEVYLRYKQQNIYGKMYYCTFPYLTYDSATGYLTEHYELKIFDMDTYYQKNGFNKQFSHTYQLDKIFVRLVRYDEENDIYYYGGMVSIDNATLNSEGVNTVQIDNGGVTNTDITSDDSYSTGQTNFIGQDVNGDYPVISLDTIGGSVTTIMSSLNDMRSLYSQGSYDSFLRTSFTFIPSEIWAIIISGLSVIVGFLIIKLIARVL